MATTIICIILIVFTFFAVRSYRKKVTYGCCGAGGDAAPKKITPKDHDLNHYHMRKVFYIDGMTCKNCVIHVENALNLLDGVYAKVDLSKNEALVYMKQNISDEILCNTISKAGYRAISTDKEGSCAY